MEASRKFLKQWKAVKLHVIDIVEYQISQVTLETEAAQIQWKIRKVFLLSPSSAHSLG